MNSFVYHYPVRQHFGKGCAEGAIKEEMKHVGTRILLAYGGGSLKRSGFYDKVKAWLEECGKTVIDFGGIMPNPTYAKVQEGACLAREQRIDFILAVGGGSVIDCCKIVSAQACLEEDIWEMQYVKRQFPTEFIPMGAVVTASGTGAEQNNGAVITHEEKKLKQPLVGAYHSFAVLDSDLTLTLPMKQVVSGAFDTLSHCMETYMGRPQSTNLSDEINESVMRSVITNLRALMVNPADDFARGELMWASAIAEGKEKLARMAQQVWGVKGTSVEETASLGVAALESFIKEIGLPSRWSEMGITDEALLHAAAETCLLMPGCCKHFTREELFEVLKEGV